MLCMITGPAVAAERVLYVVDALLSGQWRVLADALKHLILPGVTLALANVAIITRITRSSLLECRVQ